MKKILSVLLLIAIMLFSLASCDFLDKYLGNNSEESFTVSFETNGGSAAEAIQVENGKAISTLPTTTKDGYTFLGWYKDAELTTPWGETDTVSGDMTLYAKWSQDDVPPSPPDELMNYIVKFKLSNGSEDIAITVQENKTASRPTDPERDGYTFTGWYSDEALTTAWSFDTLITSDITIYAGWEEIQITPPITYVTLTFETNGGSAIESVTVEEGGKALRPADPTKDGHTFGGWYSDEAFTDEWSFDTPITSDITIYAKWNMVVVTPPTTQLTVTFQTGGGSTVESVTVTWGGRIVKPDSPIREGYIFAGWYADRDFTTSWDFNAIILKDTTLYAKWDKEPEPENPSVDDVVLGAVKFTVVGSSFETAYCEWEKLDGVDGYAVYCDGTKIDKELTRSYGTYYRCDVLGLAAGEHTVKVVPVKDGVELIDNASEFSATVIAHVREGFAFVGGDANGAYNSDGTLKSNARVLYINDSNKDTVTMTIQTGKSAYTECVGVQNILLALKKGYETKPICFRFIGNITDPAVLEKGDYLIDCGTTKFVGGITFEGVGNDATFNGFGLRIKNSSNIEIRNIGFMNCDSEEGDSIGLQQDNHHVWVHNCDIFYGLAGADADQDKGDGALDVKKSTYITISFNHFFDTGKSNLLGNSGESEDNYLTYHHNWYDHSDSRHPRVRTSTVHVYNNFYDGISKYGIGATMGASIFSEANCFLNTKYPMLISMQGQDIKDGEGTFSSEDGGIIKSFGDVIVGSGYGIVSYQENGTHFDCYLASSRDEKVPSNVTALKGGSDYNNFDTDTSIMYDYNPESAEDAMRTVKMYAGRVQGGDFKWTFTDADNDSYAVNAGLKSELLKYTSGLVLDDNGEDPSNPDVGGGEDVGTEDPTPTPPSIEGTIIHNFNEAGKTSDFFNINGNLNSKKGTITYNGLSLTQCLKMESSTSITFSTSGVSTITLILGGSDSKIDWRICIDGVEYTPIKPDGVNDYRVCTVELAAGAHEITKKDITNIYYIIIE